MFKFINGRVLCGAKLIACLAVSATLCGGAALAKEDCEIERFISDSGAISLSERNVPGGEEICLWVIPGDTTWEKATADEAVLKSAVFAGTTVGEIVGRERVATFDFILPSDGKYTALINGRKRTIVYVDKDNAILKTAELKGLAKDDVVSFLDVNKTLLGVSTDLYSANNTDAAGIVYDYIQTTSAVTESEIGAVIDKAYLIDAINKGTVTNIGYYLYSSGIAGNYDYSDADNEKLLASLKGETSIAGFDTKLAEICPPATESDDDLKPSNPSYTGNGSGSGSGGGGGGGGGGKADVTGGYNSVTNQKADSSIIDVSGYVPENAGIIERKYFKDMVGYEWAEAAINYLYVNGIVSGMTQDTYCPGENVKREEFAKLIIEMTKLDVVGEDKEFTDVPRDAWFYDSVNRAYRAEIIKGMSETFFGAGMDILREDMAVMIHNALYVCGAELPEAASIDFFDADLISDYAGSAVADLVELGVISGYTDGTFKPQATATRAEAAQIVYKALMLLSE